MPRASKPLTTVARNAAGLLPWSASKLEKYEQCPRAAFLRYVERLPETRGPAADRGDRVHKTLEAWAGGGFKKIPASVKETIPRAGNFEAEAKRLQLPKQKSVVVEEMWSFNGALEPVLYKAPDEWLRVKCDLAVPNLDLVIDHKTGKKYFDKHRKQGRVYGAAYLARKPEARSVRVEFWYLDLGDVAELTVTREEVAPLLSELHTRVKTMIEDTDMAPNPTPLCGWCSYSHTKGGPCKAG